MEKHNTKWFNVECVPQCFTFSHEERPGDAHIPICTKIPVIDVGKSQKNETIKQLLQAGQDFGFFQACIDQLFFSINVISIFKRFDLM